MAGGGGEGQAPAGEAADTAGTLEAVRAREATWSAAATRVAKLPFSQAASCCCRGASAASALPRAPAVLHTSMAAIAAAMAASRGPCLILSQGQQAAAKGQRLVLVRGKVLLKRTLLLILAQTNKTSRRTAAGQC